MNLFSSKLYNQVSPHFLFEFMVGDIKAPLALLSNNTKEIA